MQRLRRSEESGRCFAVRVGSCFHKPLISMETWEGEVEGRWLPVTSLMKKLIPDE